MPGVYAEASEPGGCCSWSGDSSRESGRRRVSVSGAGVKSRRARGFTVIYSERNGSHWKSWFCACALELVCVCLCVCLVSLVAYNYTE